MASGNYTCKTPASDSDAVAQERDGRSSIKSYKRQPRFQCTTPVATPFFPELSEGNVHLRSRVGLRSQDADHVSIGKKHLSAN